MYENENGIVSYSCLATLSGHGKAVGGIASLAFIPAGVFGDDHPDLRDGALVRRSAFSFTFSYYLFSISLFTCSNLLLLTCEVSGAYDKRILLWGQNAWLGIDASPSLELASHTKEVVSLAVTPEGDIVSGSADWCE
jgi:hypothetical protein